MRFMVLYIFVLEWNPGLLDDFFYTNNIYFTM